jgi:hypothetical protein
LIRGVDNTHIIQGYASVGGAFDVLQTAHTHAKTGDLIEGASALLYSEELTSFLYVDNTTIDTLTDWYDFHEEWSGHIRKTGSVTLRRVCITMLATTNDENIKDIYNKKAQRGGLLARTILIREEKRRQIRSFLRKTIKTDKKHLRARILEISKLKGEFQFTPEAEKAFIHWNESITDDKISDTGFEGRLPAHVVKLCMCLSASEANDMLIKIHHFDQAVEEIRMLMGNYKILTMSAGESVLMKSGGAILAELYRAPGYELSRRQLLQRLTGDLDVEMLDKILETYAQSDFISYNGTGGQIQVKLTQLMLDRFREKIG